MQNFPQKLLLHATESGNLPHDGKEKFMRRRRKTTNMRHARKVGKYGRGGKKREKKKHSNRKTAEKASHEDRRKI